MFSFLKPAQHSRQTLIIFWGFISITCLFALTHNLLTTSTVPLLSQIKNLGFIIATSFVILNFATSPKSTIITLLVLLTGFSLTPVFPVFKYVFYLISLWALLSSIKSRVFDFNNIISIQYLFTAIFIVIIGLSINWISNFNYLDLLHRGWIHIDTIWPCSIASMYKNYQVTSLGIDGLHPVTYHTFLQKTYAGISIISGLRTVEVFALLHPIIAPTTLFLVIFYLVQQFKYLSAKDIIGSLILFFSFYIFFPYRTVNISTDFFLSESMFLGTVLFLLTISTLYNYQKTKDTQFLLLFTALTYFITSTKSNVGIFNGLLIGGFLLTDIKNKTLWITAVISALITIYVVKSIAIGASSQTAWYDPDFRFGGTILQFESLLPKIGIVNKWLRIIYFTIIFYLPIVTFYYLYSKKIGLNNWKDLRIILVTSTTIISIVFNYFICIGFNTFYFTSPSVFFTFIGIITLIDFKPFKNFQLVIMAMFMAAYGAFDLFRMGHPSNCNNYVYNRISNNHKNYKSKAFIDKLMSVKPGKDIVVHYNVDILDHGVYGKDAVPFIVSALTESVTVGHVPKYDFYGHGDYRKSYKVILPKNYKIINLNDSTTSGQQ